MKVFFEKDVSEAINPGVYQISLQVADKGSIPFYIGSSNSMIIRISTHLENIKNNPEKFGFIQENIDSKQIGIIITVLAIEDDPKKRLELELQAIKDNSPLIQSGIRDRLKDDETIKIDVQTYLKNNGYKEGENYNR